MAEKEYTPTIKAVPVETLGKLGKIMLPYKGCPRGQMGRMGGATLEEEAFYMGVITDADGCRWVPVNEDVLRELVEKASDRPHGRWVWDENAMDWGLGGWICSECQEKNDNIPAKPDIHPTAWVGSHYCPNCGAKMDGERQ